MFSLRLQNIRSLLDTGAVELKPLTILVGKNNSGKSSLSRFFPLLRQSIEVRSTSPILWYGELVDFGSVQEVKSTFSGKNNIRFDIKIDAQLFGRVFRSARARAIFSEVKEITFGLELREIDNSTDVCGVHIKIDEDTTEIRVANRESIESIVVNGEEYARLFPKNEVLIDNRHLVPSFLVRASDAEGTAEWIPFRGSGLEAVRREIRRIYRQYLHGHFTNETLAGVVASVRYAPGARFLEIMKSRNSQYASWNYFTEHLSSRGARELRNIQNLYLLRDLPELLLHLDRLFTSIFSRIGYIGPTRATGERYYRIQELAVDQIDPRGENLAMFLNSLSPFDQRRFKNWTAQYLGYEVFAIRHPGHISLMLREVGAQHEFNLADVGYGLSQILPVMAQVWAQSNLEASSSPLNILAIEQPELHLHPAYQSKIADAFVGAIKSSNEPDIDHSPGATSLIVETHSQPFINRVGELIAAGEISDTDVAVYVFDKGTEKDVTKVSASRFDKDGDLRDWPFGFFSARAQI